MDKLRRKYGFMPCAEYLMPNTNDRRPNGFTLVEVLIVVAVLGILAAVVIPLYEDNTQKAKESAAKEDLRVLRNAIELYAAQHGVPPGYPNDDPTKTPSYMAFGRQMTELEQRLSAIPQNPFNNIATIKVLANSAEFPAALEQAGNLYGWIYKPLTKQIRLNWPGKDSQGVVYYDY